MTISGRYLQFSTLLLVLLSFTGACTRETPQAKRDRFLRLGKTQLEKHDYPAALLQFKNAARATPNDAEPYYQMGLTGLGLGDIRAAVLSFRKATSLDPNHAGAQVRLAELEARTEDPGLIEDAQKRIETALALDPNNVDALNTLAVTRFRLGHPDDAEAYLRDALRRVPSSVRSSSNLAALIFNKKPAEAEQILVEATKTSPKSVESWLALGRFYIFTKRLPDAEGAFKKAVDVSPSNGPALMDLGRVQNSTGQFDAAEKTFLKVSQLSDAEYKPIHAAYLWQRGKTDAALAEYIALSKKEPQSREARTRVLASYISLKRFGEAQRILNDALKKNPRDTEALLQRSELYLTDSKISEARADLTEVLRFKPEDAMAHYLLSQTYRSHQEELARRQELSEALRLKPDLLRARLNLADALISAHSYSVALDILNGAPENQKNELPILAIRNWALLMSKNLTAARQGIDAGLARAKSPVFLLQSGMLDIAQGKVPAGRASLEEAIRIDPANLAAIQALANSYGAEGKKAVAVATIKKYADLQPSSAPLQSYLGQSLLLTGDRKGAKAAYEAAQKAKPGYGEANIGLAVVRAMDGDTAGARAILHGLSDAPAQNFAAAIQLGTIEETAANYPAAVSAYRRAVEIRGDNWFALNNLAYCLDLAGQADEALKYAQMAKEAAPKQPMVIDTMGWAFYHKGMYAAAVKQLEVFKGSPNATYGYHLAMAYFKNGDLAQGRQTLDRALKIDSTSPEAKEARKVAEEAATRKVAQRN